MTSAIDFPHRVDGLHGDVEWVRTSAQRLRAATFLDGREIFWTASTVEGLADRTPPDAPPPGMIFHVGFCGSTLLARLLDQPGVALVLKEPQALTDIASQAPQMGGPQVEQLLRWTVPFLAAAAPVAEGCLVKPSNWINGLAPALIAGGHVRRAVFVTMAPRAFLRAAFRGGRERLAHCLRLAELLGQSIAGGSALVQRASAATDDPLDRAALLVLLAYRFQEQLLNEAEALLPAGSGIRLDHAALIADPRGAAQRAGAALGLPDAVPTSFDAGHHAKDSTRRYSARAEEAANREVEHHHAGRFDTALEWCSRQFTAATSQ